MAKGVGNYRHPEGEMQPFSARLWISNPPTLVASNGVGQRDQARR